MDLYQEQLRLEEEMVSFGRTKVRTEIYRARQACQETRTKGGQQLVNATVMPPLPPSTTICMPSTRAREGRCRWLPPCSISYTGY